MPISVEMKPLTGVTPRAAFWKWALLGALVSSVLLMGQVAAVGGIEGLLQVGVTSDLRPIIESELGEVPLADGPGHDGQIYYAMAVDLTGEAVPELLDHGAYRYRRIAYPLLASLFGALHGEELLLGMIVVTVLSAGVATGATASMARIQRRSDWWGLAVVLNPGVWLSVQLLTADMTAMALMLLGLLAFVTNSRWSATAFAVSGLAKDMYLLTPGGLALSDRRSRWALATIPIAILVAWMTWLTVVMGQGFASRGNLDWPLRGIVEAMTNWSTLGYEEWFYVGFAIVSVFGGMAFALIRKSWLRWPILGWAVIGLLSSNWVWDFGNNAARAFAPIVVLVVLARHHAPTGTPAPSTDFVTSGRE